VKGSIPLFQDAFTEQDSDTGYRVLYRENGTHAVNGIQENFQPHKPRHAHGRTPAAILVLPCRDSAVRRPLPPPPGRHELCITEAECLRCMYHGRMFDETVPRLSFHRVCSSTSSSPVAFSTVCWTTMPIPRITPASPAFPAPLRVHLTGRILIEEVGVLNSS
jgi:hypothetical protein